MNRLHSKFGVNLLSFICCIKVGCYLVCWYSQDSEAAREEGETLEARLSSLVWICTSTHSISKVSVIDANNPADILQSFHVCSSHLLCIASVPGMLLIFYYLFFHNFCPISVMVLKQLLSVGVQSLAFSFHIKNLENWMTFLYRTMQRYWTSHFH